MTSSEKVTNRSGGEQNPIPPSISLPKGGGAIRGIGEKFAANPVTGTGAMTVPIATSPGRSGFGPQLIAFLTTPAPATAPLRLRLVSFASRHHPQNRQGTAAVYRCAGIRRVSSFRRPRISVPVFKKDAGGDWVMQNGRHILNDEPRTVDGVTYTVRRYRPRIEGLFARIERWTRSDGDVHWRSISRENLLTLYGRDDSSRIRDPFRTRSGFSTG